MAALPRRGFALKLDAALRAAGVSGAVNAVTPVDPIVSPMCRAADWTCHAVTTADDACFVKLREPERRIS